MKFPIVLLASLILAGLSFNAHCKARVESSPLHINDNHRKKPVNDSDDQSNFLAELGWDSKYISQGRNQLDSGGIAWGKTSYTIDNLSLFAVLGRADSEHYIEWNFGFEYGFNLSETVEASFGYQRLEFYGDERASDNELFASIAYVETDKLVPSLAYTYSTEAEGYFLEFALHSTWELTDNLLLTPYIIQGIDFGYVTPDYDGLNNLDTGIEIEYTIIDDCMILAHLSYSFAQDDIKREHENRTSNLDEFHYGINLSWQL